MAGLFANRCEPVETDIALQMQRLTLDIVGEVAFSYDFGQIAQIQRCCP